MNRALSADSLSSFSVALEHSRTRNPTGLAGAVRKITAALKLVLTQSVGIPTKSSGRSRCRVKAVPHRQFGTTTFTSLRPPTVWIAFWLLIGQENAYGKRRWARRMPANIATGPAAIHRRRLMGKVFSP